MKHARPAPALLLCALLLQAQIETVRVSSEAVERKVQLTGELMPYQTVDLYARVNGYVERVNVDKGSAVRTGEVLVELSAPEMDAQIAEAESKVQLVDSQRAEAEAKFASARETYERLRAASATAGAVAGIELRVAEKSMEAAKASVASFDSSKRAAQASLEALREMKRYLQITAPFQGVITARNVHPGALVGPSAVSTAGALLRLEQVSRLRLVVAVPEAEAGGIVRGARIVFTVPAFPGDTFNGTVARIPRAIDPKTRTMPVEVDVSNASGKLAPGMYPTVSWPVRRANASLVVPASSVVTTTERTFVVRVTNGRAEWVNVRKGRASGERVEVLGDLRPGDVIVRRPTDEIRDGSPVNLRKADKK